MRTLIVSACIVALLTPSAAFAQAAGAGSLRAAAERAGGELAAEVPAGGAAADDRWNKVRRLAPGTLVRVIAPDGHSRDVHFVTADAGTLVAVSVVQLPAAARAELLDLVRRYPGALPVDARRVKHGKLQLDALGVFFDGARVADLTAVEMAIAKTDVAAIKTRGSNPRSAIGAVIGGVAGGLLALQMIPGLAMKPCGGDCGGEKALMWLSVVGLPLGGATAGGLAFGGDRWRTVY
jgi:hypothetical protein